jgi:hypothetical protein
VPGVRLDGAALSRALVAPMALVFVVFGLTGLAMPVLPLHVHHGLGFSTFVVGVVTGASSRHRWSRGSGPATSATARAPTA